MSRMLVLICIFALALYAQPDPVYRQVTPLDGLASVHRAGTNAGYLSLPLVFEPNVGQAGDDVRFVARGAGYSLLLGPAGVQLTLLRGTSIQMRFLGADPNPSMTAIDPGIGQVNYFLGADPRRWRTAVPVYGRVQYGDLYPGIDAMFYGNQGRLEYDLVVAPGGDPGAVALGFQGAQRVGIARGNLVLTTTAGELLYRRPAAYQQISDTRVPVSVDYVVHGGTRVGFRIGAYRPDYPLIIDPVLSFSTYLGGNGADSGRGVATDTAGNTYVVGSTASLNFPAANAFQPALAGTGSNADAFVTKLAPDGAGFVYSTYLGGGAGLAGDLAHAVAVDGSGNAYVTGVTNATDFPTLNAFQGAFGGTDDAFVAKLGPTGTLMYSSNLGGSGTDIGRSISVDSAGTAFVVGYAGSANFPTTPGVFQRTLRGPSDAFVVKVDTFGALDYATLLGGSASEMARGVAVDASGHVYVTGQTNSSAFPITPGAYQSACDGCQFFRYDVFVTKLEADASGLVYSTFIGGSIDDFGYAIALDGSGSAYVTGEAESSNFDTTPGAFDPVGGFDAFVTKLDAAGASLVYSTYLGGGGVDEGLGIAVDSAGDAYITGETKSGDFPTVIASQSVHGGLGSFDGFVTVVNPSGTALLFSTFLGGLSTDAGLAIALDPGGRIYVAGETYSTNFPTFQALQPASGGGSDAFVARFTAVGAPPPVADTVAITRADYSSSHTLLRVRATSTGAGATLTVYVTATSTFIGRLGSKGSGVYSGQFVWPVNPQTITVRSTLGGSATANVTVAAK